MSAHTFKRALCSFSIIALCVLASNSARGDEPVDSGSIGIRIAQIPSAVATDPFARVYIINRVQPSTVVSQRIEVFNTSKTELMVSLYPGAATFEAGKFVALNGRAVNDLTKWTKISPNEIAVKPGGEVGVTMTITTPANAPSIQQFGVIWAEVRGALDTSGITSVSRVGIRMYVPVANSTAVTIAPTSVSSSTNQIVVTQSAMSSVTKYIIYAISSLAIIFFVLFLFFLRNFLSARNSRRKREKRRARDWHIEKRRRAKDDKSLRNHLNDDEDLDEYDY